jgi:hypothetical protein
MDKRKWDLSIDGQNEDETLPRIDNVDWVEVEKFDLNHDAEFGLNPDMVSFAIGTDHVDAKIALSELLIKIHNEHLRIRRDRGQSNTGVLLPENVLDRLVYGMLAACDEAIATPNILLRLISLRLGVPHHPKNVIQDPVAYHNLLHIVAKDPNIGRKRAAKAVGISPSAAREWMNKPEFKHVVAIIQKTN